MPPILFPLAGPHINLSSAQRKGVAPQRGITPLPVAAWTISGVTRDSTGAALASCNVDLFNTATDIRMDATTSDGSGAYSFGANWYDQYYAVAYKTGSPDVAGTTVNTLTGV